MALRLSKDTLNTVSDFYLKHGDVVNSDKEQRMNHEDCPAGQDTKNRLYMKQSEDGSKVLCHCFNCGASGAIKMRRNTVSTKTPSVDEVVNDLRKRQEFDRWEQLYNEATPISYEMVMNGHIKGTDWPFKMIVTGEEHSYMDAMEWYGIRCVGKSVTGTSCMILPRGKHGFDVRWPDKSMRRITDPDFEQESKVLIYNRTNSDVGVIVEDPLSAMKVDMARYAGVALLGSTLSKDDAFKLAMRFKYLVVWLDNDNDQVKASSLEAYNRLKLYTDNVDLESYLKDPKVYGVHAVQSNIHDRLMLTIGYNNKKD